MRYTFRFSRNHAVLLAALFTFANPTSVVGAEDSPRQPHALPSTEEIAKLPADGGEKYNRLIFESSPYLLQHAANPVDWYPWGDEAFEKARTEGKPIFLSVGYSTCHWCHVMEHESFEHEAVAHILNERFVSIKVDREERPDIDSVYMAVTQALTGSGGWPMTIVMTPDRKPFFAGTYFAREDSFGRRGLITILEQLADTWDEKHEAVVESADKIAAAVKTSITNAPTQVEPAIILDAAYTQLANQYDVNHGGFGTAPKFPTPHQQSYLLRHWRRTGNETARDMVMHTLDAMRRGGIFDHVGLGFHRYSTDAQWLTPHFEKMLYDQALIAYACIETYQATQESRFADTARETLEYVLRDMTAPEGGFYSAEDADSEGEEGRFYVWTLDEVTSVLGSDDASWVAEVFNLEPEGNWTDEASRERTGTNIFHLSRDFTEISSSMGMTETDLEVKWEQARKLLFDAREKRVHPAKDDKILTDWNGLMIAALAKAGNVLENDRYIMAARKAASFTLETLRDDSGRLLHRYRNGEAGLPAHLEDYAFMTWGLIELYGATFDVQYLETAIELTDLQLEHFWDDDNGGFFQSADDSEELLLRNKEIYDGAIPSGNSIAAWNLLRLARMTGRTEYEVRASKLVEAFGEQIQRAPSAFTQLHVALDFAAGPSHEVVIAGKPGAEDTVKMLRALQTRFLPNMVVLLRPTDVETPEIVKLAEFTQYQTSRDGKATAYVCQNFACEAPTTEIDQMLEHLRVK